MIKQLKIDNVDYTQFVSLPVTEQYALDESLDNGVLVLKYTKIDTVFKPYSKVVLIYEDNQQTTYYVAQDEVTKIIGGNYYNHRLTLIEETKILEKIVVDSNTITQPLLNEYLTTNNFGFVDSVYTAFGDNRTDSYYRKQGDLGQTYGLINDPQNIDFPAPKRILERLADNSQIDPLYSLIEANPIISWYVALYNNQGQLLAENYGSSDSDVDYTTNLFRVSLYSGTYKLVYDVRSQGLTIRELKKTIYISVMKPTEWQELRNSYYTITDVVNRLLRICETLEVNETPRFIFNEKQEREYGNKIIYRINQNPNLSSLDTDIYFNSNSTDYSNFKIDNGTIKYDETIVYNTSDGQWTDEEYQTIIFQQQPEEQLLTWLKVNATLVADNTQKAPEFSFTRSTLKECLDQVGGYIHGIPRLENDVIYFDKLGQMNEEKMPLNCIGEIKSQNIEQYCTNLDTHADNIINLENSKAGTITEPYINGFETVRAETGVVRITDSTAIIETEYPIAKIEKLIVGYVKPLGESEINNIDITDFVYENAEYQALSSYTSNYPFSKAFAIYYTQGQPNIYGLGFKMDDAISQIFKKYSIINILEKKTGKSFADLINIQPFVQLNFQIVYYPIVSARIGQSKQDLREYDKKITSIYNQSANMVDSTAYGENLKGAVMRLGNVDVKKTYLFPSYDYIYPVGTLVDDDYYISTVEIGHYKNYIKCTYGLSKDFNRLSQYIGIKNNIRMYEVSEKQAVDRYILSEDYMVFESKDDSIAGATNKAFVCTEYTIKSIKNDIENNINEKIYPTVAICQTDVKNTTFALPVVSLGIGNSILYTFSFKDNYSAGNYAENGSNNETYTVQTYTPYGDMLGRTKNINIKLSIQAQVPNDKSSAIEIGNALPLILDKNGAYTIINLTDMDLQVYKDNREKLIFNHQVHLVSRLDNFIISSNLATYSNLIGAESSSAWKLYILPNKINKFEKDIDLTGAKLVSSDIATDYTLQTDTINNNALWFENNVIATASGKAWAVVKEVNSENKLLFGRNIDIMKTDEIELPKISLVHKIFN